MSETSTTTGRNRWRKALHDPVTFCACTIRAVFSANSRRIKISTATPKCVALASALVPHLSCEGHYPASSSVRPDVMPKYSESALEHIRVMETRIARQTELVERLQNSGEDSSEATKRLELLKSVLTEMRSQLGPLTPTDADIRRKSPSPERPRQPRKK